MVDRCSRKQQFPQLQARTGEADFGWEAAAAVAEVAAVGARVSGAGLRGRKVKGGGAALPQ